MYSEFELDANKYTNKMLITPNAIDCKENVLLLGVFFNPNPIKIIKKGTNR